MNTAIARQEGKPGSNPPVVLDALVIGAGVAGLYQLHQLRRDGLQVVAVDTAGDVGGTWYWNRYPGAKFDSESYIYQYLFDEDLYKGWTWSERFPASRDRALDALHHRPAGSAARHPVFHHGQFSGI
ncbi:NAD(P)-binding protein [Paracoccus sp. DMF-8]|uniref:NAD(P)-binding protein n=1 Tax=Paracoccus sp. DMF-8 TaxID=3019445 RepID=UPI0023E8B17C|nr:NAD(P)-binding protein [Paracoccus sp. DMF-8]MDF3605402.1 NAD(P)-binding protein [Paracoccus sp. DMF-8]